MLGSYLRVNMSAIEAVVDRADKYRTVSCRLVGGASPARLLIPAGFGLVILTGCRDEHYPQAPPPLDVVVEAGVAAAELLGCLTRALLVFTRYHVPPTPSPFTSPGFLSPMKE